MADYRYRVPAAPATAQLRQRGSRFLAWVGPVEGEEQAQNRIRQLRTEHPDATHHCWAWRLDNPARERSSDDGEPAGTAGVPMLQVLRGSELSDVLAVVGRWFGGTKLGKGGLARAYGGTVRDALQSLRVAERMVYESLELEVPYEKIGAVQRLVRPPEVELRHADYGALVRCTLRFAPPLRSELLDALASLGLADLSVTLPVTPTPQGSSAQRAIDKESVE